MFLKLATAVNFLRTEQILFKKIVNQAEHVHDCFIVEASYGAGCFIVVTSYAADHDW